MNQTLKTAIEEIEALPTRDQEELARTMLDLALRRKLDAELKRSIERGGATPHDEFMAELRTRYGS